MDAITIKAILDKERSLGNPITREEILEHLNNFEQIRINHLSSVEREHHDPHKHGEQIVRYVRAIAKKLGCSDQETSIIAAAARFHDIGKTRIDKNILNKPGLLTNEERNAVRMHAIYGQEMMSPLRYVSNLMRHHHERFDGNGYPDGLSGKDIPLGSRIISAIDAFNAMTHQRSYNKVKSTEDAIEELKRHSGTQFDPDVIREFISILNTVWLKKHIDFYKE